MKKISIIFIVLSLLICSVSCSKNLRSNSSQASSDVISEAVPKGFLLSEVKHKMNTAKYTYNEKELLVLIESFDKNGKLSYKQEFGYDENNYLNYDKLDSGVYISEENIVNSSTGKRLSGTIKDLHNGTEYLSTYTCTYDEKDRLLVYKQIDVDGNVEINKEYTYLDENGSYRLLTTENSVRPTSKEHYINTAGYEVEIIQRDNDGNVLIHDKYQYDDHGNRTETTDKDGNTTKVEYEYKDNLITSYKVINSDGEVTSKTVFEYDEYGNKLKEKTTNASGSTTDEIEYVWVPKK